MTISSIVNRASYPGTGTTGPFTIPFRVFAADDIRVIRRSTGGTDTVLTITTDYTVSGVGNATGTLTLVTALAVGETLVIRRAPALTQPTSVQNQASYYAKTHEDEFDRLVMQVQALQDKLDQAFALTEFHDPASYNLQMKPETGKVLGWLSSTQLGNLTLDAGAIGIPAGGRTVSTLTAYLLNNAVFNVKDFGAIGDGTEDQGGTDDTAAIQAAVDAAVAAGGGAVYFPTGRYRTTAAITITGDDITLFGDGPQSEFIGWDGGTIGAASRARLTFMNMKFTSVRGVMTFASCTDLAYIDCYLDGVYWGNAVGTARVLSTDPGATRQLTPQGVLTKGCTRVHITGCTFKNFNDAIYLDANAGATPSTDVIVDRSFFFHEYHNNVAAATPTGVYLFKTDNVTVANCFFKDIQPQGTGDGYGVYEGDGTASKVSIIGCHFVLTDFTAGTFHGVLISQASACIISGCVFSTTATFEAFAYGARSTVIADCIFDNAYIRTAPTVGVATFISLTIANNIFKNAAAIPLLIWDDNTTLLNEVIIRGNHFYNCAKGAMWLRYVTYAMVADNVIVNCNTDNDSSDQYRGGINFVGCESGFVDGNTVMNTSAAGKLQYGVVSSNATHTIQITPNNRFVGMTIGSVLRPHTAPPTTGAWALGSRIHAWNATSGAAPGWVCTTAGTPGTWKAEANLA